MPPKLTAEEIAVKDAARLNELGYKQVNHFVPGSYQLAQPSSRLTHPIYDFLGT
jgi:hypothetical protein